MKSLDRKGLLNKFGFAHFIPFIDKINEIVVAENVQLIRLGQLAISHTTATPTTKTGTTEVQNATSVYIPTRDIKINKIYFLTNIADAALTTTTRGTLTLSTVNDAGQVDTSISLINVATSADSSFGFNDVAVNFIKDVASPVTLEALISQYFLSITLDADLATGTYNFEVYVEVEYVD